MLIGIKFELIGLLVEVNEPFLRTSAVWRRAWSRKWHKTSSPLRDSFRVRHLLRSNRSPRPRPSIVDGRDRPDPNHAHTLFCFFISDSNSLLNRKAFYSPLTSAQSVLSAARLRPRISLIHAVPNPFEPDFPFSLAFRIETHTAIVINNPLAWRTCSRDD